MLGDQKGVNRRVRAKRESGLRDHRGMASIETALLLVIFVMFISYALGFFGVIHTGIMNSMGARRYAFETFRHRNNVTYFRESAGTGHYKNYGVRAHRIRSNVGDESRLTATRRPISIIGEQKKAVGSNVATHNNEIPNLPSSRNKGVGVDPVWIMVTSGICIDAECGGE